MTKRLFLAINIPPVIKNQLTELILKLQKNNKNKPIKWVAPKNLHLTLHFLGSVPEQKIPAINRAIEPIVAKFPILNFALSNSINSFPDLNNPKVIFLEIKELNDGQTIKLQKKIGESLAQLGFKIDKRPFHLHLTLGRVKFKTTVQIPNLQYPNSNFQIDSIDLMESQITLQGPIYSIIKQYNLV
ncbi:MAG: RNA 2',3'-cyclic phosphodiesterase [Candidatus Buchananbacteria bacterium]|nr:RNA 2',3'-cyclic phosphodiesterase [Candidatus Buchananbacteria bacterium]